jgi:uncharacterized damage-inducible protein DinB
MDLLDRLLGHDAWTTGTLFDLAQELSDEQLDREFDLGQKTVRNTIEHIVRNIEGWTDLMNEQPVRPRPQVNWSLMELRRRYDLAVVDFENSAKRLRAENKLDDKYIDTLGQPPRAKSFGGTILHVLTHNHSHRTEILHMMERLGVKNLIEGDVLGWEETMELNG